MVRSRSHHYTWGAHAPQARLAITIMVRTICARFAQERLYECNHDSRSCSSTVALRTLFLLRSSSDGNLSVLTQNGLLSSFGALCIFCAFQIPYRELW